MSSFFEFVKHSALPIFVFLCVPLFAASSEAQGFQPVSPEELKMTSEPQAPGAPAVILLRQVDRDDEDAHEDNYFRIKVLTGEGRQYGDIEIPFSKPAEEVVKVHARTIRPDGSIAEFNGEIVEKTIAKVQGLRYLAKTFVLPDVQAGSIIEYYYRIDFSEHLLYGSRWILNERLFTRTAKFSLKPYESHTRPMMLRWTWHALPPGSAPQKGSDGVVRMEVHDIPAFQYEDYMPPPDELRSRVNFIYEDQFMESDPDQYWRHVAKTRTQVVENFIGKRKAMDEAVAQIVAPSDPPEVKLRKIYDRVQLIRNKSFELRKTEQEHKREKEKAAENVEDVWKRGYGTHVQLTWLFLALVRAAGFEAYEVWASSRRDYFFNPKYMESRKLNVNVVMVKRNGSDLYFDPGAAFAPFGMLTWSETGTPGLCLNKEGGTWVKTSLPLSSESLIEHAAKFKLTDTGSLEGRITTTYTGLEALYARLDVRNADDFARRQYLEERIRHQIPASSEVRLTNQPDWDSSETPLIAEYEVSVPEWTSNAGKRTAMPSAVFSAIEKRLFEHENRVHPIYMNYPYEKLDEVTIALPAGWQVESLPETKNQDTPFINYALKVEKDGTTLHLTRKLSWDFLLLDQKYYPALRNFLQNVQTADEQPIVLAPAPAAAGN